MNYALNKCAAGTHIKHGREWVNMIIAFNILLLLTLILIELMVIKQFWMFNFELQKVRVSVERHRERIETARRKIEMLDYDKDELLCETCNEHLIYKKRQPLNN